MDDDLGGVAQVAELRVEPPHLAAGHEHERGWGGQPRQLVDEQGGCDPPAAEALDVSVHPGRRQLAARLGPPPGDQLGEAAPRPGGDPGEHGVVGGGIGAADPTGIGQLVPEPAPQLGEDPPRRAPVADGSTTAGVCWAAMRGLRKSHSVTSGRSSWSFVGRTWVESAVVSFPMISIVAKTSSASSAGTRVSTTHTSARVASALIEATGSGMATVWPWDTTGLLPTSITNEALS